MKVKRNVWVAVIMLLCSIEVVGCQSTDPAKPIEAAGTESSALENMSDTGLEASAIETIPETIQETVDMAEAAGETTEEKNCDRFTLTFDGFEKDFFYADCVLEYDSEELRIYVKDIEYDKNFPFCGTALYMQTSSKNRQILGVSDYYVDQEDGGRTYCIWRNENGDSFSSMYVYSLGSDSTGDDIFGAKLISTDWVEEWLQDAYQLTVDDKQENFSDLWLIMTAVEHDEQGNTVLKGEASGVYGVDGRKYHVDWEIGSDGEEKIIPHESKIYDKEADREIFAACEEAFDRIEECDKSLLTLSSGQVEYFTKAGEQRRKENEERIWQRVDVNGDGLPELVASERVRDEIHSVDWIFAYTGGMKKTVEAVYSDLNDYTEFLFLGSNGNLVYDYSDHGILDYGGYSQYRFDGEKKLIEKLEIYYFYEDEFYEPYEEDYKESYPDTYGKNGSGYYYFQTRLKAGVTPEHATDEDWVREEITREEFVEAYREMTGFEFFEVNQDFLNE